MYNILTNLRIVEGASFIAAPICGLHLLQLGAEVVRFDNIGGGPDFRRWPLAPGGASLYWEGLNKGKKSVALDLTRPEGRDLAVQLATAPGTDRGVFVTNYPPEGFLSHARLSARRSDIITVRLMGWADGTSAVDYTVNSVTGLPLMTGPGELGDEPVNHVLPAWDLLAGAQAAIALLAAERDRRSTGRGREIRVALSDVAMATLGHLGQIAEVTVAGADRSRLGNDLYGAFGRDFRARCGRRVMIVAITPKQWSALLAAFDLGDQVGAIEQELGVSFAKDEGRRFEHRERLFPLVERAVANFDFPPLAQRLDEHGVCWGPYLALKEGIDNDQRLVAQNPVFAELAHPSGVNYFTPGSAVNVPDLHREVPTTAPLLGEHTHEVLAGVLGLPDSEIAALHDKGIVASPAGRR